MPNDLIEYVHAHRDEYRDKAHSHIDPASLQVGDVVGDGEPSYVVLEKHSPTTAEIQYLNGETDSRLFDQEQSSLPLMGPRVPDPEGEE